MRIAQLAPLWKTVPPERYGGSELVVHLLSEQLVKDGHSVTLLACGGSTTTGRLVEVIDRPMYDILGKFDFSAIQPYDLLALNEARQLALKGEIDIIHNHMGFHIALLADWLPVPMVTTNHSSIEPDFPDIAHAARGANYVSISNAQRKAAPYLNYVATVYHGIETDKFPFNDAPDDYLLFMPTLWNEKGVDRAVEIARKANVRLIMAGDIRRQSDFDAIKPYIDGKQISYLGEIDFDTKVALFSHALAHILPIRWNEAFGLTAVEALACGTPVIAWPNGSMPELIEDGKTGFLVDSVDGAVQAIKRVHTLKRKQCREAAVSRFDVSVMAKHYVEVYKGLLP